MDRTIFALSAPVGGAITIMRISGENTRKILENVFDGSIEHRRCSFGRIVDEDGNTVDTCNTVFFSAPHSYTGEDMAEISIHGSYAVAQKLTQLIGRTRLAEPAAPGEFTKRAYLNGKMDLAQAEAVMDIIASTAERQRHAAARQLEGRLSAVIAGLYERTKQVCARVAASMDDETGEIEADAKELSETIGAIRGEINELTCGGMRARILREGARIAIIGSPNVGKSSLLNALISRERAIVTEIPGTTRDTVEEAASIDGLPVVFIDTAGIRETSDAVERMGIERSRRELSEADLVLLLIDSSRETDPSDDLLIASVKENKAQKTLVVFTKSDLERKILPDAEGMAFGLPAMLVSSVTGDGLKLLRKRLVQALAPSDRESVVTNVRHIRALEEASSCLDGACDALGTGFFDAAFEELRQAMQKLSEVTGREDPAEELVDSIFADFCIGK